LLIVLVGLTFNVSKLEAQALLTLTTLELRSEIVSLKADIQIVSLFSETMDFFVWLAVTVSSKPTSQPIWLKVLTHQ